MAKRAGSRGKARTRSKTGGSEASRGRRRSIAASIPATPPAPAPPPPPAPPAEAVALFQRGMEAMQRHDYTDAARAFQGVLMGFAGERALTERARVYLALCEREGNHRPPSPRTLEERLTAATAALNNDADAEAEELARSVLGDDPRHDLALYLLAAVHARRGDNDEALSLLGKVVALTPEASAQARADADFDSLHDIEAFWTLTEPPAAPAAGPRKGRRARSER
jgi:tetratricopeptide (TPR) repeat protein